MTMVVEAAPTHCAAGHPLGPRQVLRGWSGCNCRAAEGVRGHRTHQCRTCDHTTYDPPCANPARQTGHEYGR